jgi:hypothetical protein
VRRVAAVDGDSEDVRGHVHNVSLPAFLQLMEMERKTCTLTVHSEGRTGTLFLRRGELLEARAARRRRSRSWASRTRASPSRPAASW